MIFKFPQVSYEQDGGEGGGSVDGDQGGAGGDQTPGWISALPDEFKGNDYVKGFQKPGDFVKASLDLKTQHEALQPKLESAIFKPGEDATTEETAAFHKALGVPDAPGDYEFPKGEGIEHDEKMLDWARGTFHEAKLNPDQASVISQAWDGFMQGIAQENETAEKQGIETADQELRTEWKADYDKNIAETQRGYEAFEKAAPGFAEFLGMDTKAGISIGNHPMMLKVFHVIGKTIGDDGSLPSLPSGKPANQGEFSSIYKTPNPPRA